MSCITNKWLYLSVRSFTSHYVTAVIRTRRPFSYYTVTRLLLLFDLKVGPAFIYLDTYRLTTKNRNRPKPLFLRFSVLATYDSTWTNLSIWRGSSHHVQLGEINPSHAPVADVMYAHNYVPAHDIAECTRIDSSMKRRHATLNILNTALVLGRRELYLSHYGPDR